MAKNFPLYIPKRLPLILSSCPTRHTVRTYPFSRQYIQYYTSTHFKRNAPMSNYVWDCFFFPFYMYETLIRHIIAIHLFWKTTRVYTLQTFGLTVLILGAEVGVALLRLHRLVSVLDTRLIVADELAPAADWQKLGGHSLSHAMMRLKAKKITVGMVQPSC